MVLGGREQRPGIKARALNWNTSQPEALKTVGLAVPTASFPAVLESLVYAGRSAQKMTKEYTKHDTSAEEGRVETAEDDDQTRDIPQWEVHPTHNWIKRGNTRADPKTNQTD